MHLWICIRWKAGNHCLDSVNISNMVWDVLPQAYTLSIRCKPLFSALLPEFFQCLKLNCDEYEALYLDSNKKSSVSWQNGREHLTRSTLEETQKRLLSISQLWASSGLPKHWCSLRLQYRENDVGGWPCQKLASPEVRWALGSVWAGPGLHFSAVLLALPFCVCVAFILRMFPLLVTSWLPAVTWKLMAATQWRRGGSSKEYVSADRGQRED